MIRVTAISIAVLLAVASSALAADVEYKGTGGVLNNASNWYILNDIHNDASTAGTKLPALGDAAFIRNGTTGTINYAFGANQFQIGSPSITGVATRPMTTLNIVSPAVVSVTRRDVSDLQSGYMSVGGYYPGTVNMTGGSLDIQGLGDNGLWVGQAPRPIGEEGTDVGNGTFNLSGGKIYINSGTSNNRFCVGAYYNATGTFNITGGTVDINGENGDRTMRVGVNGTGTLNLSNGIITDGHSTDLGVALLAGTVARGLINQTGGSFGYFYRMIVGENFGLGHYKLTGGTFNPAGGLWLGRHRAEEATPGFYTGCAKLTLSQNAVVIPGIDGHLLMGQSGGTSSSGQHADHTQLELKLGSAANFNAGFNYVDCHGGLEVSLVNGYAPAPGTEWKVFATNAGGATAAFETITPGFSVAARSDGVYLIAGSIRHAGDANNDGKVNVGDLGILAGNWGQTDMFGKAWTTGDFNGDDVVNVGDLGILAGTWGWIGTPAAAAAVPEPASLTLLVLTGLTMLRRRR